MRQQQICANIAYMRQDADMRIGKSGAWPLAIPSAWSHWLHLFDFSPSINMLTGATGGEACTHLDKIQPTMGKVPSAHKGTMNGPDLESIPYQMLPGATHLAREGRPAQIYIRYNPPRGKLHKYKQWMLHSAVFKCYQVKKKCYQV